MLRFLVNVAGIRLHVRPVLHATIPTYGGGETLVTSLHDLRWEVGFMWRWRHVLAPSDYGFEPLSDDYAIAESWEDID